VFEKANIDAHDLNLDALGVLADQVSVGLGLGLVGTRGPGECRGMMHVCVVCVCWPLSLLTRSLSLLPLTLCPSLFSHRNRLLFIDLINSI